MGCAKVLLCITILVMILLSLVVESETRSAETQYNPVGRRRQRKNLATKGFRRFFKEKMRLVGVIKHDLEPMRIAPAGPDPKHH